jgi:hypothetical protein
MLQRKAIEVRSAGLKSNEDNDMDGGEESGSLKQQGVDKIPTLYEIAKGKTSKYNLDDRQYIAYQIVCCTFLLQLMTEGINTIPSLETC